MLKILNPLQCELCHKYIEADDFEPDNEGLSGDWRCDENGKIIKWICEECSAAQVSMYYKITERMHYLQCKIKEDTRLSKHFEKNMYVDDLSQVVARLTENKDELEFLSKLVGMGELHDDWKKVVIDKIDKLV